MPHHRLHRGAARAPRTLSESGQPGVQARGDRHRGQGRHYLADGGLHDLGDFPCVAVIGAGASGLTALKALCEAGLAPVAYEASSGPGGLWRYDPHTAHTGPAYASLRTNTSKQLTAFSDLPFPPDAPDYPARSAVERYLLEYARRFDLGRRIRFNTPVESIRPGPHGGWEIDAAGGVESYDAVVVCSGIFRTPLVPDVPGLAGYTGKVLHSLAYSTPEPYTARHVLVIGLGSSAADIAQDLVGAAASVTLSTRRGVWLVPREVRGAPFDLRGSRLITALPAPLRAAHRRRLLLGEYARRGVPPPARLWRERGIPFDPERAPSVTSDALLPDAWRGAIDVRPAIARIEGGTVRFVDGSTARPDSILFCTGYRPTFPFLPERLVPWRRPEAGLYRLVFPVDAPGLAFVGVCRVQGPILPLVEMQARWVASVIAGRTALPSAPAMRAEIARRLRRQAARGDSTIRVPLLAYMDEIAAQIGVKPSLLRHPRLLPALLAGPPVAAQYRLQGPNHRPEAAEELRRVRRAARGAHTPV